MTEYFRIHKDGLDDFRAVILPNIWEQLILTEDPDAQGLILIGAAEDGMPVGALAARAMENEELVIQSIYVSEEHRCRGIASQMMQELLAVASGIYTRIFSEDFPLHLHVEYILPEKEFTAFTAFLDKQGFSDFREGAPTYLFDKAELTAAAENSQEAVEGICCAADLEGWDADLAAEVFEAAGFNTDPALCYLHRNGEDADFIVAALPGGEGDFYLVSTDGDDGTDPSICNATALALTAALCSSYEDLTLVVDGERNKDIPLWEMLLQQGGSVCGRCEAGMYVIFEE